MSRTIPTNRTLPNERFENEDKMVEVFRAHLREARRNGSVGKITFEVDVNRDGPARFWVEITTKARFLQNSSAV